jgi:hypothetical protein
MKFFPTVLAVARGDRARCEELMHRHENPRARRPTNRLRIAAMQNGAI